MPKMQFVGVDVRARDARSALNRLHWEVEYAIDQGKAWQVANSDLAEAVAIMANIVNKLDEALPDGPENELERAIGSYKRRFLSNLAFYYQYHKDPR
jgi:hypothetical protein